MNGKQSGRTHGHHFDQRPDLYTPHVKRRKTVREPTAGEIALEAYAGPHILADPAIAFSAHRFTTADRERATHLNALPTRDAVMVHLDHWQMASAATTAVPALSRCNNLRRRRLRSH